jgi:hypothetical protein
VRKVQHAGRTIIGFPNGGAVCFLDGTVLFAGRAEALPAVIDRATRLGKEQPPLPASMTSLPGTWDVRTTLDGAARAQSFAGIVLALAAAGVEDAQVIAETSTVKAARWGLDAESADRARVLVELTYADAERTAAARPVWEEALQSMRAKTGGWGLGIEGSPQAAAERVVIDVRVSGLAAAIGRYTEWAQQEAERRRTAPED